MYCPKESAQGKMFLLNETFYTCGLGKIGDVERDGGEVTERLLKREHYSPPPQKNPTQGTTGEPAVNRLTGKGVSNQMTINRETLPSTGVAYEKESFGAPERGFRR